MAQVPMGDVQGRAGHLEDQLQAGACVPRHVHQGLQFLPVRELRLARLLRTCCNRKILQILDLCQIFAPGSSLDVKQLAKVGTLTRLGLNVFIMLN